MKNIIEYIANVYNHNIRFHINALNHRNQNVQGKAVFYMLFCVHIHMIIRHTVGAVGSLKGVCHEIFNLQFFS